MKRLAVILLIMGMFNMNVHARGETDTFLSRITFGLEWGYVASVHSVYHLNFFAPEGYRMDIKGSKLGHVNNADMYLKLGYDLSTVWNMAVCLGYKGIADIHRAVPLSFRMTRYFNDNPLRDRWFGFIDLGSGISLKKPVQEILTGKVGGGYRLSLSRHSSLDFLLSARLTYTHPEITYDDVIIPLNRTNRNNAFISAISVGMAVTF